MLTLRVVALLAAYGSCLPVISAAEPDAQESATDETPRGDLAVGFGYFSDDMLGYGRYAGPESAGFFPVLDLELHQSMHRDDAIPAYWYLYARDLGLHSREAGAEWAVQGSSRLTLDYDETIRSTGIGAQSPFTGNSYFRLPESWQAGANTAAMTALSDSLHDVRLETTRRKLALGFSWRASEQWRFSGEYLREQKRGQRSFAGVVGSTGGNSRAVMLPEPIDYLTDNIRLSAAHDGVGVRGSKFVPSDCHLSA